MIVDDRIRFFFFFSSRRRHTRCSRDWSSDVCSSDLPVRVEELTTHQADMERPGDQHEHDESRCPEGHHLPHSDNRVGCYLSIYARCVRQKQETAERPGQNRSRQDHRSRWSTIAAAPPLKPCQPSRHARNRPKGAVRDQPYRHAREEEVVRWQVVTENLVQGITEQSRREKQGSQD